MEKLLEHTATVICPRDGEAKLFHYQAARRADGSCRFGVRYGCPDKSPGCAACIRCWNDLRQRINAAYPPTA